MKWVIPAVGALTAAIALAGEPAPRAETALPPVPRRASASRADGAIQLYQSRIQADPGDFYNYQKLGESFVLKARETGDSGYTDRAAKLFTKALELRPDNDETFVSLSGVTLARHEFRESVAFARRAVALAPERGDGYGALGDALLNLGDTAGAGEAYQRLRLLRPGFGADVRLAQLEELHGDIPGAVKLMESAIKQGLRRYGPGETVSWAQRTLADLYFGFGDLSAAGTLYEASLEGSVGRTHALTGLARVAAARGDYPEAVQLMGKVIEATPLPSLVALLGDIRMKAGDEKEAGRQYDLVRRIGRASLAAFGRELSLFHSDHGDPEEALRLAREELEVRQDVYTYDALAWALFKSGCVEDALVASREATRLGTRDARLLFHAGVIRLSAGDCESGRDLLTEALRINPHFDLLKADEARLTLAGLTCRGSGRPLPRPVP